MAIIVVAEDDFGLRTYITVILERAGHTVLAASGGEEALDLFRSDRPDMLVTDHEMPDMDGATLFHALRRLTGYEHTPVVLLTAYDDMPAVSILRREVNGSLVKPFARRDLLVLVAAALDDVAGQEQQFA